MRQISERERRIVLSDHELRCFCDPTRRCDRCRRSPELEQRKRPKALGQVIPKLRRDRVAVRQLAPVRLVDRPRRCAEIMAGCHVVPPEHVGAAKPRVAFFAGLPDFLAADQPVRLPPEQHLHLVAKQPAVADDAVIARRQAGHERSLHAAGDCRGYRLQRHHRALTRKRAQRGRVRTEMPRRQTDHDNRQHWFHLAPHTRVAVRRKAYLQPAVNGNRTPPQLQIAPP